MSLPSSASSASLEATDEPDTEVLRAKRSCRTLAAARREGAVSAKGLPPDRSSTWPLAILPSAFVGAGAGLKEWRM